VAPTFSAIIPLHNKAATIQRAVKSILAQTVAADQIVVIENASTDNSVAKLNAMAVPGMTVKHLDTPGPGGYAARNLGVLTARAEWVCFLDADDEWQPDHLASAAEVIQANTGVNTIFFGRRIHKDGHPTREIVVPEARAYSFDELVTLFARRNVFHINSLVIRRATYLAIGGFQTDRGWHRGGDSELFLRVIRDAGPVFVSPKITTLYDMNFSDVTGNSKHFIAEHPLHRTVLETVRTHPESTTALKRLSNRKIVEWLREMPNEIMGKKLSLLFKLHPCHMTPGQWYKLFRDFRRQPRQ